MHQRCRGAFIPIHGIRCAGLGCHNCITSTLSSERGTSDRAVNISDSGPQTADQSNSEVAPGVDGSVLCLLAADGRIVAWNRSAQTQANCPPPHLIGLPLSDFLRPPTMDSGWLAPALAKAAAQGIYEMDVLRPEASHVSLRLTFTVLHGHESRATTFACHVRNISFRGNDDQALRETEQNFRLLVESVQDYAIFRLDKRGVVSSWNRGAQRIKGYSVEEIVGRHFSIFYPESALAAGRPEHGLQTARRNGHYEDEGWRVRKDGTTFWANVVITAIFDATGTLTGYSKITRDLTEIRRHQQRLKDSEEHLRLLVEGVKDHAIFLLDMAGLILEWNAGAARMFGYKPDEVTGQDISRFYVEEDRGVSKPAADLAMARQSGFSETSGWRLRRDGSRLWTDSTITALHGRDRTLHAFAVVIHDLSDRRRVQELEVEGQRVNEFIAMLSHELRNPLAPIGNTVGILRANSTNAEIAWCADMIERQVTQLSRLVNDLLEVSRFEHGRIRLLKEPIELTHLVANAIDSLRVLAEGRAHILDVELPTTPMEVEGDPVRLTQVIVNLLTNAIKFTPNGGRIRVQVYRDGRQALLSVSDNGVGMSKALLESAFDLFVQGECDLARADGGLGIGLTLVKRIVTLHGGSISAFSAGPNRGSEFEVLLPLHELQPPSSTALTAPKPAVRHRLILVVDDNRDVADSLTFLLQAAGHDVLVAYDGKTAIDITRREAPEVVLLDIGLPDTDGYEVARRLRKSSHHASLHIIALSGYAQERNRAASLDAGFDMHLVKPVEPSQLCFIIEGLV